MQETGTITRLNKNTMLVEFERTSMCEKCGACERGQKNMIMEVTKLDGAQPGDRVAVELPEGTLLKAALIAYGIPLVLLIAGLYIGGLLPEKTGLQISKDLCSVICGLLLAGISYLILHLTEKKRSASGRFAPVVVALNPDEETEEKEE